MNPEPEILEDEYEPINDLLDYLIDGEYDDYRDGWLHCQAEGTSGSGDYYYTVTFRRADGPLQEWFVTISEQSQ